MKQPLIETVPGDGLRVVESDSKKLPKGVLLTLEGPFGETEKETENGRAYPNSLWRRVIDSEDFQNRLRSRSLLGEADHPEGLESSITRVSHAITDMKLDERSNVVGGRLDVLDTPAGRIVKTLVDYGWKPGISSRGAGEIVSGMGRQEIDPETYEYITHDLVIDPACRKAHLDRVSESRGDRVPLKEALTRLAERDKAEYEKQEAMVGAKGYFERLFKEKFGIDISDIDVESDAKAAEAAERDPRDERIASLEGKVRELADRALELHKKLEDIGVDADAAPKKDEARGAAVSALVSAYDEARRKLDAAQEEIEKLKSESGALSQDELDAIKRSYEKRLESLSARARSKAGRLASSRRREAEQRRANARLAESQETVDEELEKLRRDNSALRAQLTAARGRLAKLKAAESSGTASPDEKTTADEGAESQPAARKPKREGRRCGTEKRKRTGPVRADVRADRRPKRTERRSSKLDAITERAASTVGAVMNAR